MTRTATSVLCTLVLLAQLPSGAAAPKQRHEENTCRSVGALKFDADQRPMQRTKGLDVCTKYKRSTCCNSTHTQALRLKLREPAVAKFNEQCQKITEEMVCSSCHPLVGTWQMKTVCPRLCSDWFSACKSEFYSYGGSGTLAPCYGNALICSPLSSIAATGDEFCAKMGFHVGSENDSEGDECFDGSVPLQAGVAEPVEPWQEGLQRLFEEQSSDPSGLFMLAVFAPLVVTYFVFRVLRRKFDGRRLEDERHLQLLEVRRLQQAKYGRQSYDDYDSDSDSVDDNVDDNVDDSATNADFAGADNRTASAEAELPASEGNGAPDQEFK